MSDSKDSALRDASQRIQKALDAFGVGLSVREFPSSTRTAAEAAATIGCTVGQIAKSLIFRGKTSGQSVLVIASGANRVDEKKVKGALGEAIGKADADFVREKTGFSIGGVPPVGHAVKPIVLIDRDLMQHGEIWAAAGTPFAVFRLEPETLVQITGGTTADLRKE